MDVTLHYKESGSGEPLLLLHGNGDDSSYFDGQIPYFSKKYRVTAIDTRGHGKSPRGSAPFSIRQFAEDLNAFMEGHNIPNADILGFSDGANIALLFALKYPQKVNRLIVNGADLFTGGVKRYVQLPIELGYKMAALFAGRSAKARKNAEMLGLMVNDPRINPEELDALTMPALVIAGTKDIIKASHTRLIYDHLPNARLAFIEGGHFIAKQNPDAFNAAVDAFLSGQ